MKKINYLIFLLLLCLFMPRVDALSYNIGTKLVNTGDSLYEIKVSLKDIADTDYGVAACSMNINLNGNIALNTKVRSLGGWSMTVEKIYLFDTGSPALENTEFMIIPVKATGNGVISISNIKCSDGDTSVSSDNISINVTYNSNANNGGSNGNHNNNLPAKDSNSDLVDIILSDGTIEFNSDVTEYSIEVDDFEKLIVTPKLASDKSSVVVDRNVGTDVQSIVITVSAEDGSQKEYTIYVKEIVTKEKVDDIETNDKNYTPIFIGIICILVIINIFRIVKNIKKKS